MSIILDGTLGITSPNETVVGQFSSGSTMGFKNRIINGNMAIDQRNAGASVTISGTTTYTLDRWLPQKNGAVANYTAQRSTIAPVGFINSQLFTMGTGVIPTGTDYSYVSQNIEGFNSADLGFGTDNATTVTLSFWVRSSVTGTFGVGLRSSSGGRAYIASYTISSANTWEQKSVTIAGDTSGTWLTDNGIGIRVDFDLGVGPANSTTASSWQSGNYFGLTGGVKLAATTGATFYITGVQLEKGSVATSFDQRAYGTELSLCQRYYQNIICSVNDNGAAAATKAYYSPAPYQCKMRVTPTATFSALEALRVTSTAFTNAYDKGATYTVVASGGPSMSSVSSVFLSAEL